MKVLYSTEKVRAISDRMGDSTAHDVEAWFQFHLHDGPPDPRTWEGGGQTMGYWREQRKRLKDPTIWTFECHGASGVAPAVIPNEIVNTLPDDARVTFMWTVCRVGIPAKQAGPATT